MDAEDAGINRMYGIRHISRSFVGLDLEEDCPCGKAPCGMVDTSQVDENCEQHSVRFSKTIRRAHLAEDCLELKTFDRLMPSLMLSREEVTMLLEEFTSHSEYLDEPFQLSLVNLVRKMAVHIGRDPNLFTPLLNRYQYPHKWTPFPQNSGTCAWCERPFEMSSWHEK